MKTKKRKLNVRLLRRIQRHITEEPRRFMMDWFYEHSDDPKEWRKKASEVYNDLSKTMPSCGTAACIAGWAVLLSGNGNQEIGYSYRWNEIAHEVLGFDGAGLFLSNEWPVPYSSQYNAAKTPKQRAKIACARIDHLIKTGE